MLIVVSSSYLVVLVVVLVVVGVGVGVGVRVGVGVGIRDHIPQRTRKTKKKPNMKTSCFPNS